VDEPDLVLELGHGVWDRALAGMRACKQVSYSYSLLGVESGKIGSQCSDTELHLLVIFYVALSLRISHIFK